MLMLVKLFMFMFPFTGVDCRDWRTAGGRGREEGDIVAGEARRERELMLKRDGFNMETCDIWFADIISRRTLLGDCGEEPPISMKELGIACCCCCMATLRKLPLFCCTLC